MWFPYLTPENQEIFCSSIELSWWLMLYLFCLFQPSVIFRRRPHQGYKCVMFTPHPPPNTSPPSNSRQHSPTSTVETRCPPLLFWSTVSTWAHLKLKVVSLSTDFQFRGRTYMTAFILDLSHHLASNMTTQTIPESNIERWLLDLWTMIFPALSIHQLAAQGEMVFLASRIEQGEDVLKVEFYLFYWCCRAP